VDQRLKSLSVKKENLSTLLFVQDGERLNRIERLRSWAETIESDSLSEAKGTLLLLAPEDETFQANIKVDDVRSLLSKLSLGLWDSGKRRYVLIPYAEKLTSSSSNALLKILEEPPESTIFLLMTSSRKQVLDTILSRSLIVNMISLREESLSLHENVFYRAMLKKDFSGFLKIKHNEALEQWREFYSEALRVFKLEDFQEPQRFFDTIEGIDKRLHTHMDHKWISSFIARSFHV